LDPDAYRAAARERKRERKAQQREEVWREQSARAAVDVGVKTQARVLAPGADLTAHNAWDTVPWDEELERTTQRDADAAPAAAASAVVALCARSDDCWDEFYKQNLLAYKHRRYLRAEFPELCDVCERAAADEPTAAAAAPLVVEIGCGPGNAALPLLAQFPHIHVCACDIAPEAVRLLRAHPSFPPERCDASVWDVGDPRGLPAALRAGSADAALLVFVLSALPPAAFRTALRNVHAALKPGGLLLFRDYGRCDEKQRKFTRAGGKLADGWYARQNGTLVYFFSAAEVHALLVEAGFEPVPPAESAGTRAPAADAVEGAAGGPAGGGGGIARYDKVLTVNRKTSVKLWRVWVTARYRKATPATPA
jgi:tRNAThr (cytosine32-N3)-methyltransferase